MDQKRIRKLLNGKEGIQLEFKTASTDQLPKNLFESICGMLNREGGDIFLGVDDSGTIVGINETHIDQLTKDLVNLSNNPSKLVLFRIHRLSWNYHGRLQTRTI